MIMLSFTEAYGIAHHSMMISAERASYLYDCALEALKVEGEFWECGVYRGGSALLIRSVIEGTDRVFRLFDTFKGFVVISPEDGTHPTIGLLSGGGVAEITERVNYEHLFIREGVIPETFEGLEGTKIAFVNLDVDLYVPTLTALQFILPRMVKGGVIVIDDYGAPGWPGVKLAVDECFPKDRITFGCEKEFQIIIRFLKGV